MRHHHRIGAGLDPGHERHQVGGTHRLQRTVIHRDIEMGVFRHRAVAREMLEGGGHAGFVHARHVGTGERRNDRRVGRERAVADRAVATRQVDHRRKAQVHAGGADLAGHQPGVFVRQCERGIGIVAIQRIEALQRRQRAVTVTEALHAAALLVHADQLRARCGLADGLGELGHLGPAGEVAREQDHAGTAVVLQPVALLRGEFMPGNADLQH